MNTGPNLYYDGLVSYDFPKIQFYLMQISTLKVNIDPEDISIR